MKGYLRYAGRILVKNAVNGVAAVLLISALAFYLLVILPQQQAPKKIILRCGESVAAQEAARVFSPLG